MSERPNYMNFNISSLFGPSTLCAFCPGNGFSDLFLWSTVMPSNCGTSLNVHFCTNTVSIA